MPGNAFVYGTLMADEVVKLLIRRVPSSKPAVLHGYTRYKVKGQVFPAIVPSTKEAKVDGKVLLDLSDKELQILDVYEAEEYYRATVAPVLPDGSEVAADVYVWKDQYSHALNPEPWSYDEWRSKHLDAWVSRREWSGCAVFPLPCCLHPGISCWPRSGPLSNSWCSITQRIWRRRDSLWKRNFRTMYQHKPRRRSPRGRHAVLVPTETVPDTPIIRGHDFNNGRELDPIMDSMLTTGFQATTFGQAIQEVNRMINWRLRDEPVGPNTDPEHADPEFRAATRALVFLGFTSNLTSAGVREHIRYLAQHRMVDVLVTTAGGIEEDFIKCMGHTYVGDFQLKGAELRMKGLNRIGNMLVPNSNYCKFEDWIIPILDACLKEQNEQGVNWTPSKLIDRLGKEINHPDSIYYWAHKNGIPVFCPAITDGSIGDMLFFHSYKSPGLRVDVVEDIRRINDIAMRATPRKTGMIILGGGVPKHHICNANLMRNGADFAVYVNTAQEFDGSDSGARPDEAVSWGKIRIDAKPVKVCGDATILFPLLISQTFARHWKPVEPPRKKPQEDAPAANGNGTVVFKATFD